MRSQKIEEHVSSCFHHSSYCYVLATTNASSQLLILLAIETL